MLPTQALTFWLTPPALASGVARMIAVSHCTSFTSQFTSMSSGHTWMTASSLEAKLLSKMPGNNSKARAEPSYFSGCPSGRSWPWWFCGTECICHSFGEFCPGFWLSGSWTSQRCQRLYSTSHFRTEEMEAQRGDWWSINEGELTLLWGAGYRPVCPQKLH